jgi:hypothetical protein
MKSSNSIDFLCQSHKRYYNTCKLNCGPSIWDKTEVLLGVWGTFWEHIGNIEEKKKRKIPPHTKPKRKKKTGPPNAC